MYESNINPKVNINFLMQRLIYLLRYCCNRKGLAMQLLHKLSSFETL